MVENDQLKDLLNHEERLREVEQAQIRHEAMCIGNQKQIMAKLGSLNKYQVAVFTLICINLVGLFAKDMALALLQKWMGLK